MRQIWIVDDDEEMVRAVQLMLKLLDYDSRYFLGARPAAQELLAGRRPDLLILDISMPEVSGLDMLEFLRMRKEFKVIPVIMLSTEAAEVQVDMALSMGADAYVTKPVALEELEAAILRAFQAHNVEI
jgi:two-component system, OmpR family, phosphate regulon response regulator PhoB